MGPVLLLLDAAAIAAAAWLLLVMAGLERRGLVESALGWLLLALAWIAGSGVILGLVGGLGRGGYLVMHGAGLAALLLARRGGVGDWRLARAWLGAWRRALAGSGWVGWSVAGLLVALVFLAVLAAQAEPIVYDALTYRLSRVGAWLQEGRIGILASDDPRLNYMPVAPDLVVAWLLGAAPAGYQPAALAQWPGGLLLIGATFGLARSAGLSRPASLGAVALLLGMANVAVQFTTIQTDLFTAGVFAASYLLWHRSLERGEGSWVAGVGIALAFASKGTMFYLVPGAALWGGWHVWRHRDRWRALLPTMAGLTLAGLVLVVPGWWRNHATYGSWAGPHAAVVLHHGEFASPWHYLEKMLRNLGTSAVQLFAPMDQPFWLQGASRAAGVALMAGQPVQPDEYVFMNLERSTQLEFILKLAEPDADVAACGLIGAGLFLAGLLAAGFGWSRLPGAPQIFVWGAGVAVYFATQHALVQWHHWAFRFMVLVAPWMAVCGTWVVALLPRLGRVVAWAVVLVSSVEVFITVQARANQAAWQAVTRPARAAPYYQYLNWRLWAERLDQVEEPLRVAFPIDRPLAAFYRLTPARPVYIGSLAGLDAASAEIAVGTAPGWLVVPSEHFMGREGRVLGRVGPLGVAAYRALRPGEKPQPLAYAFRARLAGDKCRDELLLRTWVDVPVRLELSNPDQASCPFELRSPAATLQGVVPAAGRLVIEVPLPPEVLCWITIEYAGLSAEARANGGLRVRLAP